MFNMYADKAMAWHISTHTFMLSALCFCFEKKMTMCERSAFFFFFLLPGPIRWSE